MVSITSPHGALDMPTIPRRHGWRIAVYDTVGNLVDLPMPDVESIEFEDVLNGGSGQGTLILRRDFNNIGAISYGYTIMVWVWTAGMNLVYYPQTGPYVYPQPVPYYWGTVMDIDQEQMVTEGKITVHMQGLMRQLDRAIVTEEINPNIDGNSTLDAAKYIDHLLSVYQPTDFGIAKIPTTMFDMLSNQFDGTKLAQCLDTVIKQGRDSNGGFWTWFVRPSFTVSNSGGSHSTLGGTAFFGLNPVVVVRRDQNPNLYSADPDFASMPIRFIHIFSGIQTTKYSITTKYRDIQNVVTIYGGQDPNNGTQVYGSFGDSTSTALFGPWEEKISVPAILDATACANYATVWTAMHGYPTAQGEIELTQPDPRIFAGQWINTWEQMATTEAASIVKQWRVAKVSFKIADDRIVQTLSPQAPTPYLDEAVYKLGLHQAATTAQRTKHAWANRQQTYVRDGGDIASSSFSGGNGHVVLNAGHAVFSGTQVTIPGGSVTLLDNSGGPLNGQGGVGYYTVSINSSGTVIVTKNAEPNETSVLQHLRGVTVIGSAVYI